MGLALVGDSLGQLKVSVYSLVWVHLIALHLLILALLPGAPTVDVELVLLPQISDVQLMLSVEIAALLMTGR